MAAVSAAPASVTLTPPSSSHGNDPWVYAVGNHEPEKRTASNGDAANGDASNGITSGRTNMVTKKSSPDMAALVNGNGARFKKTDYSPPWGLDEEGFDDSPPKSTSTRGTGDKRTASERRGDGSDESDESSKWIHRDKLVRIETEEAQAAGIVLPKPGSGQRKDRSVDRLAGRRAGESPERAPRPKTRSGSESTSRIPVARFGPSSGSPELENYGESLSNPKPRSRSASEDQGPGPGTPPPSSGNNNNNAGPATTKRSLATDGPGKKASTNGTRKPPAKPAASSAARPKTRGGGADVRAGSGGNRPTTRSGDPSNSVSKRPEGNPPWMISAYQPDPRLPPDQQLLPTVARRLQQEQWEREGKFGSVYDKEFRPLNDDGFREPPAAPPQAEPSAAAADDADADADADAQSQQQQDRAGDWPLKQSPVGGPHPNRASSYSTMPKLSDNKNPSPLNSPQNPQEELHPPDQDRLPDLQVTRLPEESEDPLPRTPSEKKSRGGGCGLCCIVM